MAYYPLYQTECYDNLIPPEKASNYLNGIANKVFLFIALKNYAKIETIEIAGSTKKVVTIGDKKEIVKNKGQKVILMDSSWFRKIIHTEDINVRGFFRLYHLKDGKKEIKWINEHIRHGFVREAKGNKEN